MLNFSLIDNTSWISAQCKSSTAPAIIPIRFTHAIISLFCVGVYFFKLRLASGLFGLFFCISNCQVFFNVCKVHTDCASFFLPLFEQAQCLIYYSRIRCEYAICFLLWSTPLLFPVCGFVGIYKFSSFPLFSECNNTHAIVKIHEGKSTAKLSAGNRTLVCGNSEIVHFPLGLGCW